MGQPHVVFFLNLFILCIYFYYYYFLAVLGLCFFFLFFFLISKASFFKFIYLWLCWVFVSVRGLSLVAASEGHSSSRCAGLSLSRRLLLRSTGSRRAGSVVVAHGLSCSVACGILPDQGSNPYPLHWQADSQPLRHQGSPWVFVSVRGLSLVAASGGHSSSRCTGLSLSRPLLLRSTGSRCAGLVVVAHGPSCSVACGILPDQGSNPYPLHWQADSQPLCHQGSPQPHIFVKFLSDHSNAYLFMYHLWLFSYYNWRTK